MARMSSKPIMPSGDVERVKVGQAEITTGRDSLAIEAPGARNRVWIPAAAGYGVPWLAATLVVSVWYLGWGMPDGFIVRVLLWLVTTLMLVAMHALAVLSIWAAMYARIGVETLVIDPQHITVIRRAGRFPIRLHIRRTIVETASLLPERPGRIAHPRVELKSWRAAIRFGAGLSESEAAECARVVQALFDWDEEVRRAAERARGLVSGVSGVPVTPAAGAADSIRSGEARTGVMQAYREALDGSKGPLRGRLGALASAARSRTKSSRRRR